ncbi:hypothetical protein [Streptomyces sp. NBC_01198]|uniref:hypothetical protein n=1 Tax=Streptomyces sp. NBC_01198 TaxID=2903769 RepID=UPI002E116775|nr:hypothetical protein OG702_32060 [Streptomyces sp. NBC_01198]
MPEEQKPEVETGETPPESKPPEGNGPDDKKPDGKPGEELPPEVLRKKLTDANAEAANYRTKLREAEDKLSKAKTVEEFETATADLKAKNAELERSLLVTKVAGKHELPAELAELLKGDDEAALEEHAKKLAKLVGQAAPEDLSGGLNPSDKDDGEMNPRKLAGRVGRRRF